ncbi:hypothetical protein FQN55_008367 [Onygenales sp. PD_40]|nr:hypothetical protein FQN55_008367 [Onygenales sp. PD_40]KAK2776095.1 hypothetical protein FQN52_003827 [Onygenales sp. PD_12]KAK2787153.1 hypothetical protein FQN51_003447 [Onygenales sp. PD_10]
MAYAPLDAGKLELDFKATDRPVPEHNSPEQWSQSYATDHILTATWDVSRGWAAPKIGPYSNISLPPTASVFHYATACFEGLKVYRGYDGRARLFRPNLNAARLLRSATRLCLPSFDPAELEKLLVRFAAVEAPKWAPESRPGTFFYLRPVMIATQPTIGLQPPGEALLYIVAVSYPNIGENPRVERPLSGGDMSSDGKFMSFKATETSNTPGLKLWASSGKHTRAWPGGAGDAKVGSNYGPTLLIQDQAGKQGFDQVLWLYGGLPGSETNNNPLVTEAGGSNFFLVWKTPCGKTQLVTAPLDQGIILPGVTRQSIIELARSKFPGDQELDVVEEDYGIEDVIAAYEEGRLLEAFAAGTAYFVTPVKQITYKDKEVHLPLSAGAVVGKYTAALREHLAGIKYGVIESEWATVLEEQS